MQIAQSEIIIYEFFLFTSTFYDVIFIYACITKFLFTFTNANKDIIEAKKINIITTSINNLLFPYLNIQYIISIYN